MCLISSLHYPNLLIFIKRIRDEFVLSQTLKTLRILLMHLISKEHAKTNLHSQEGLLTYTVKGLHHDKTEMTKNK
jgi:hypothetical protein